MAYPCVYALTSTDARRMAAVRDLDLRPVTERRFVHLKEIRGTLEASGSSPPRLTTPSGSLANPVWSSLAWINLLMMQWVLLALVVVFFGVIEFRLLRDFARLAPVRSGVKREAVVYRTPISAQWSRGWWGRGNAKGMRLVVREKSFELSYPFPGGSFLTTEWYCWGKDARMKIGLGSFLPPRVKRDCIVLSIPSIDEPNADQEILISSVPPWRQDLSAAWDALVVCGVQASGDPPSTGS